MGRRPDARFHAAQILTQFDRSERRLSQIYSDYFQSDAAPQDRPAVTFLVQEVTRWRGYLDHLLVRFFKGDFSSSELVLKNILRLGAYEIIFRKQVPAYAAVNEAVQMATEQVSKKAAGLVNAVLRKIDPSHLPRPDQLTNEDSTARIAAVTSHPRWIIKRWINSFGFERTLKLCEWNNRIPQFSIRRNRKKVSRGKFESLLSENSIEWSQSPVMADFYTVNNVSELRSSAEFLNGDFSFQDISAGFVTHLVDEDFTGILVDACAAPGGKASYFAERLGDGAVIHSYDADRGRLQRLRETLSRLDMPTVHISCKDAMRDDYPVGDVVFLDVPCTGTGVMAKRADLRWRRHPSHLSEMLQLQESILRHMSTFVKPGGKLIYSTCSLEPEENWGVVEIFMKKQRQFEVAPLPDSVTAFTDGKGALATFPPDDGIDGVFAVSLRRKK
ncbi:MAG TPA: 16S rRNA (cytosine(967)-C(5))-methyltransferase RsmB [Candidatus Marinimicrobia bacterium]|nr:16S rRNA (cytosine(967)-C(5))-methyltransferase RsmB [Candidatus Neomarinimicrobiota bacterium]